MERPLFGLAGKLAGKIGKLAGNPFWLAKIAFFC